MKVGFGYDVHPLVQGEKLVLGGVNIPFSHGLKGHSDADALAHAIIDALLGAAGLGDIGSYFPDSDPKYKDISSLRLLEKVAQIISTHSYLIENIDTTIVLEEPKLKKYIPSMQQKISETLSITPTQISIKATKEEKLGFVGQGKGIKVFAIALIKMD